MILLQFAYLTHHPLVSAGKLVILLCSHELLRPAYMRDIFSGAFYSTSLSSEGNCSLLLSVKIEALIH